MNYFEKAAELLATILSSEPFSLERTPQIVLERLEAPRNRQMGDIAFPCHTLSKELKQAPPKIAAELLPAVQKDLDSVLFEGVEAAGPYLNFRISTCHLASTLIPGVVQGDFLARRPDKNQRVMIEYSQPNTHKAFHVGHTRNVSLGDALVRICEWVGYDVVAANYIGDEGAHIAKCLWYYRNYFDGVEPETRRGEFLGELYSNATELLDFSTLTQAPHPNVITARVESIQACEGSKKNSIVEVHTGSSKETVICGGVDYTVGDIVPYAKPGARIKGRLVEAVEREGVHSNGMICSEKEISAGKDTEKIFVFPPKTEPGLEIAEVLRIPGALPNEVPVIEEMQRRENGVSSILKGLEGGEAEITQQWQETRQWSLDEFNEIYDWLDARFDHFFYESEVGDSGKQIVDDYLKKGVLVRSEGAVGADLAEFKLPFFILLRSDGTGLYSTKDISLAQVKFEEFGIDRSIYVVDESQSTHFKQVFKTLELMGYEKAQQCFHLAYGMVVLPDGKMSSRSGNVILFSALRERLLSTICDKYLNQYVGEWPQEEIDEAAKRIAIATIKYGMLSQDNNKNIVFDLDAWTSQSGNTGPYLLYAYARIRSILNDLGTLSVADADWSLLVDDSEGELLRHIARFPNVATDAAEGCQPHLICAFLYDLSKGLNRFYTNCHVMKAEAPLRNVRGLLIESVGKTLQKGLALLGIKTVDRM